MNKRWGLSMVAGAVALAGCSHTMGRADHIALDQTPPAVLEGFHRAFPGLKLLHTDKVTYLDGTVKYELKFRDVNKDYYRKLFSVDGELLDSSSGVVLPAQKPAAP